MNGWTPGTNRKPLSTKEGYDIKFAWQKRMRLTQTYLH